jgi:NAD(P)-dependent dehydrogenase (short-subunit alcohol dehydrogenase family)
VNCIVPGHIRTPLSSFQQGANSDTASRLEEEISAVYLSNQILKRRGEPDDCAQVALFLASDRARHITGITLPVEAGVTAGDPVNHLADIFAARASVLGG